jgi:glycerol transport system ATP-binding protein
MNFVAATGRAGAVVLADGSVLPPIGPLAAVGEGAVTLGFRPNHLYLRRPGPEAVALPAIVQVVEITGSESFVHVHHGGHAWVALAHGVHELAPGAPVEVYVDPHRMFVFGAGERLVAAPTRTAAAA